jgi:hypothetical protein
MKHYILLLLVVVFSLNVAAQSTVADSVAYNPIDIRGSRVFMNDLELDKNSAASCFSSVNGLDRSQDYLKYRAGYKTGLGLTVGGASLAVFGLGSTLFGFIYGLSDAFTNSSDALADAAIYLGMSSMVVGSLCFVAGIPTLCVYKTRLNRLEKGYNTSLSIGASPTGLSLSINF